METLLEMLSYRRPAHSATEKLFIERYIAPHNPIVDDIGNQIISIGDKPHIAWLSHTDTVHRYGGRQQVNVSDGIASAYRSDCLGADDTVGVWLMLSMIKQNVPGLYIFHRAEELGCQGSKYIANNTPEVLHGIEAAISLDRYGYNSIITHQMGQETASVDFALSLARALNMPDLTPDSNGVFTDSAQYAHIVPECTNLSVGYYNQHTSDEVADLFFAEYLLEQLLSMDSDALIIERQPKPKKTSNLRELYGNEDWFRDYDSFDYAHNNDYDNDYDNDYSRLHSLGWEHFSITDNP